MLEELRSMRGKQVALNKRRLKMMEKGLNPRQRWMDEMLKQDGLDWSKCVGGLNEGLFGRTNRTKAMNAAHKVHSQIMVNETPRGPYLHESFKKVKPYSFNMVRKAYQNSKAQWDIYFNKTKGKQMESRLSDGFNPELLDLEKIYVQKIKSSIERESHSLRYLVNSMRDFIKLFDETQDFEGKLQELRYKMGFLAKGDALEEDENE